MMIIMAENATAEQLECVITSLARENLHVQINVGEQFTAVAAIGDVDAVRALEFSRWPGVAEVVAISKPFKLASREFHPQDTEIRVGDKVLNAKNFWLMAGPCSVESLSQTSNVASALAGQVSLLRAGVFKPRTSPFSFQGLGAEGIEILAQVKTETGLAVISEVMDERQLALAEPVVDVFQVGARNMQNYGLLKILGEVSKPVLLKRSPSGTLEELLQAADYILKGGNGQVMLCERGIRTFEPATRFTLDISAVPWLKAHSHLPVIVDPSHAAGDRRLVASLSAAAAAAGADGLLIEVSDDPETALSDGPQQLYSRDFPSLRSSLETILGALGRSISYGHCPRAASGAADLF